MGRELLFRYKNKNSREWKALILGEGMPPNTANIDAATVGLFTGLYDSTKWKQLNDTEQSRWLEKYTVAEWKGRPIFNGDIIKTLSGLLGAVEYGEYWDDELEYTGCGFFWHGKDNSGDQFYMGLSNEWSGHEVVGNVVDNPNLIMKESKNDTLCTVERKLQ